MRKLLLGFGLAVAAVLSVAMTYPPAQDLFLGQQRVNGEVRIGSAATPVRIQGPVYFDDQQSSIAAITVNPDGGPSSLTGAQTAFQTTNKGYINYDFPAASDLRLALSTSCFDSSTVTIANCPFGSQLSVGVDQALAAGPGTLTPYLSAANTAFVRACSATTDGGSFNMPDASYVVRCTP